MLKITSWRGGERYSIIYILSRAQNSSSLVRAFGQYRVLTAIGGILYPCIIPAELPKCYFLFQSHPLLPAPSRKVIIAGPYQRNGIKQRNVTRRCHKNYTEYYSWDRYTKKKKNEITLSRVQRKKNAVSIHLHKLIIILLRRMYTFGVFFLAFSIFFAFLPFYRLGVAALNRNTLCRI